MILILPLTAIACALVCYGKQGQRDAVLRGLVLFAALLVAITEILSAANLLQPAPLFAIWLLILFALTWPAAPAALRFRPTCVTWPIFNWLILAAILSVAAITAITALVSPPNSADALAYHLPRVIYWMQSGSVSFFPTSYYNQVSLQPMSEYLMLHTYLLSGSDRFVNLGADLGIFGSAIGVSLMAELFGAGYRGQLLAALFCITLPNGILQASGAKNDSLLALWLVAMCYFALRYRQRSERRDLLAAAAALGLALLTKGTAYLFAPPLLLAILFPSPRILRAAPILAAGVLLINAPHYWRNLQFSGSPLGFASAQADGFFRVRNDTLGWRQTVSNALRNTSEQLGDRSPRWNRAVYDAVLRAHAWLGIDPNDPATTWRWTAFAPPKNSNHEADANNRWHLLLLLGASAWISWRRRDLLPYALAIALAFLLFCFYLKWQPYLSRMFLPLFILGSPLVGVALEKLRPAALQAIVCLFLVNNARPYLFENWIRPWRGPNSIWTVDRDRQYFSDMGQWNNRASFEQAVAVAASSGCDRVGVDISLFHVEYPFQVLLRERSPAVRFTHSDVDQSPVCAVLCMDCAGVASRVDRYRALGGPRRFGRFLLFTKLRYN